MLTDYRRCRRAVPWNEVVRLALSGRAESNVEACTVRESRTIVRALYRIWNLDRDADDVVDVSCRRWNVVGADS